MKTILFAAAASVVALAAMPAAAQGLGPLYLQGNLGYSLSGTADTTLTVDDGTTVVTESGDIDLDNGFLVSGALGTATHGVRVEAEALYSANDLGEDADLGEVSVTHWAAMANVLYDFAVGGVAPYVGAGLGYGNVSLDTEEGDLDDSGLAWQLRAGVTFGEAVKFDIGYRYLNMADFEASFDDGTDEITLEAETSLHAISVGVRFPLGG